MVWKELVVHKFNNEDVIAREAMERFYAEEDGWNQEQLYRPICSSRSGADSRASTTAASSAGLPCEARPDVAP